MTKRIERVGKSVIAYDDALVSQIKEDWFEPSNWSEACVAPVDGRGQTLFVHHGDEDWVLRHYNRGGLARWVVADKYIWFGAARTRGFLEWDLLSYMTGLKLPVPPPVAARYIRHGGIYTADLLTRRIPKVQSLSRWLLAGDISKELWHGIGKVIAQFHRQRIDHADLSAHNIQIDSNEAIFILDFDRGRVRSGAGRWMRGNLNRLRRSLRKISRNSESLFSDQEWDWLLKGYRS
jgi:3-deoxy-D-manno-octulosonic acid kinase